MPPSGFNRGYYSNPEVDRLIDERVGGARTRSGAATTAAAQQLIAEDAPYIPIWNRMNVIIAQPGLAGLHLPLTGDFQSLKDVRWAAGREGAVGRAYDAALRLSSSCALPARRASRGAGRRSA